MYLGCENGLASYHFSLNDDEKDTCPVFPIHPKFSCVTVEGKLIPYDRLAMMMICHQPLFRYIPDFTYAISESSA